MAPAGPGGVVIDLQAVQSPHFRGRGVARWALDFTAAVVERHPGLVEQVLLQPGQPGLPVDVVERLGPDAPVTTAPDWSRRGGVYHALGPLDLDVPASRLWPRPASRAGRRLVVTVYDLIPEVLPGIYLRDPGTRLRYRAHRQLIRAADHVLAISQSTADDVVERLGVPAGQVTVVGAAPHPRFVPPADRDEARAAAVAHVAGLRAPFAVYPGAVEPRKNMDALVEAFAALPRRVRDAWQLVLVCRLEPPHRHHYEVRARQLGIEGQLLLTGFVPDEALTPLYQAADLVVFPSLYEGFGLPVAEAMACGAPVIGSRSSAIAEQLPPDATFDPADRAALAAALGRALGDEPFRERLRAWAGRPRPGWPEVADRAAAVYQALGAGCPRPAPARRRWRRRPLVAVVTPWPPAGTGVAAYSARLVGALRRDVDVEVYADGDPEIYGGQREALRPPAGLPRDDRLRGGYDAVVLCLGNSEFHAGALALLGVLGERAVVLAHDVRLTGLYLHGAARGAVPEGFAAVLARQHPELAGLLVDGALPPGAAEAHGVLLAREAIARSGRFLTTSEAAARLARLDAGPADVGKVAAVPFAYPPVVPRPPEGVEPGLVVSLGVVDPAKCPDLLVDAFAAVAAGHPGARLVFVGPVSDAGRAALEEQAARLGLADRVTLTGRVGDAALGGWLRRAAVAVQLRRHSNGETSAAAADCLAHGIPTVVSAVGAAADLPDVVVKVPPDVAPAALGAAVSGLLADPVRQARLGTAGQRYAAGHGADRSARCLLEVLAEGWPAWWAPTG